jgi:hypothetical protein
MFTISSTMTSISEGIRLRKSFVVLSYYSCVQKRIQYVLLKVACKNEEYLILLNIIWFPHLQMAQHNAVTPVIVIFFILSSRI